MPKNRLAPESRSGRILDFFANLLWSIVWLGRWTIRLLKRIGK
ncbi:hypothetical protein SAMN02910356_00731 [Selenomonas sp. GACV-9]|nr:hypothetical protein SAMN02910356_00731 [Selenomonas ruminantium]